MRRVRYCCAISLDGYIAGPGDEFDWIVMDPEIDVAELSAQFDTWLVGRRTFEVTGGAQSSPGSQTFVFSRTLRQGDHPNVTIVGENWQEVVAEPSERIPLTLIERRTYEKTGTVMLVYAVKNSRRREAGGW